ncbi:MAG: hypothetical protein RLZ56_457 [Bacteroidota bacterium]|jgi:hypothetical protein
MKKNFSLLTQIVVILVFSMSTLSANAQRAGRGSFGGSHFGGGFVGHTSGVHFGGGFGYHTRVLPYGGIYRLPSSYIRLSFGGYPYYFADGLFYTSYGEYYGLVAPPFGLTLGILPRGYWGFNFGGFPYFYYSGVFYKPTEDKKYQVVQAPVGAEVPSLPKEAKPIVVNDQKLYEYLGTYYKEVMGSDGKIRYIVQGKDGVLNTDNVNGEVSLANKNTGSNTPATIYLPTVGDVVLQLPSQFKTVIINGKKLYVTPEHIYYEEFIEGNVLKYRVVGM